MRKNFLLILCSLLSVVAFAAPITKEQARQAASQFLTSKGGIHRAAAQLAELPPVLNAVDKAGNPYIYAFNAGNNAGYVLVSGDDRFVDVLGYSNSGSFDNSNMPDNMRAWLQGYVDEMKWAIQHGDADLSKLQKAPRRADVKKEIVPLMKTHWNQGAPYNSFVPEYEAGKLSATGCVATAMAQAMYYNKWPVEAMTDGIPAYVWKDQNLGPLPSTTFDWDLMLEDYTYHQEWNQETEKYENVPDFNEYQANAVAHLMLYCGYSVEMNYGASSGTSTHRVADALKEYYDYASTTTYLSRNAYSYGNWIELIYHELAQNRVVVYNGQSSGGGHAFICDGYQGEDYFHINWGWGGTSDDYFKLSVLNPYEQGIGGSSTRDGFTTGQGAIVGIQKNGGEGDVLNVNTNSYSLSLVSISANQSTVALGEPVDVTVTVRNNGTDEYDGDLWLYVEGIGLMCGKTTLIPAGETKDCVITLTPNRYTGTYNIYAFCPVGGGYYREIKDDDNQSRHCTVEVIVSSGDNIGTNVVLSRSVVVENLHVENDRNNIYGPASRNNFKATITVTNTDESVTYSGYYQWNLYWLDETKWRTFAYASTSVRIPANGGSVVIPVEVEGIPNGGRYMLSLTYYNTSLEGNWTEWDDVGQYYTVPAIVSYDKDGEMTLTGESSTYETPANALCVDLTGINVSTVTPNTNPNTLYIIGNGQTSPTGASNVLTYDGSAYSASSIQLADGNDFYSPVDFTADNIEFTYSFTVPANGTDGWNTLVLPYDVTEVTADNNPIDWFHSGEDTGKNFWLKKFTSDGTNMVYFDYADEFKANTPYIVAFPGDKWGSKWDMSNKVLKFKGTGVQVKSKKSPASITGSSYRFVGSTQAVNTENIYTLNDSGNNFVLNADGGSGAFRAFFKPGTYDYTVTSLSIGNEADHTTGVQTLDVEPDKMKDYTLYNLNGQRISKPTKGLYFVNGKKVIIK